MPTDVEIAKVKRNLEHLQRFNDYLYDRSNAFIVNAYVMLSETQADAGKTICVDMMQSAFKAAAGAVFGPVGTIGATILCGAMKKWDSVPYPLDMENAFTDLVARFAAASQDVDVDLATYHADPVANWDVEFTYEDLSCTLGDLATIDFPAETDPEFFTLLTPCQRALDQYIWKYVLLGGGFQINEWLPGTCMDPDFDFNAWGDGFYPVHPSYWGTCYYHQDTGDCGDASYWDLTMWNLATGAGMFSDGHISDDAANYLFCDLSPGTPNPKTSWNGQGLYTRDEVFSSWGMKVNKVYSSNAPAPIEDDGKAKGWFRYVRAKAAGKAVISSLQAEIGLDGIKTRILAAVKADPSLRAALRSHPRETMEQILGVVVPEFAAFTFVMEGPHRYGLVIPWESGC